MLCKLSFDAPYIRHIRAYKECLSWVANTFFCAFMREVYKTCLIFPRIEVTQLFNFFALNVSRLLMCFRDIFYQSTSPSLKGKILFSGLEFIIYITSVIFTQLPRTPTWISHKIIFPTRDIMNPRPATISQTQERLWAPHKLQLFYPQNMTSEERQQRFHTDDVLPPKYGHH